MSHTGGWRNDLLGLKPSPSALAALVYHDTKSKVRWVWIAQADDLAPIYTAASGLLAGLIPKETAIMEALSAGLADKYHAQCSGSSVPKGALLRAVSKPGGADIKGVCRILWQELSMIDPPLKHKNPQAVADWIHASLLEKFPGIHHPMVLPDITPTNWVKCLIEPSLIRARSLSLAREISLAIKEPIATSQPLQRL